MVDPKLVIKEIRRQGGACRKVRGKPEWDCSLGETHLVVSEDVISVRPPVEYGASISVECYPGVEMLRCFEILKDKGFEVDYRGKTGDAIFEFNFPLDEYDKAISLSKVLNEDDIWVSVGLREVIQFNKGDESFDDPWDFADHLRERLTYKRL